MTVILSLGQVQPANTHAQANLAISLFKTGKFAEAAAQSEAVLRLEPDSAAAHNNHGNFLRALGRLDEARRQYEEALRLEPGYRQARANLDRLPL